MASRCDANVQRYGDYRQSQQGQRESKGTLLFLWPLLYLGWVVSATPRPLYRYLLYRELGRPQDLSRQVQKSSTPSPGFDSLTVQPVASCWFVQFGAGVVQYSA